MKKNNHGISFVELILTIAIAAILGGVSIYSLRYLKSTDIKSCVNDVDLGLDKVRVLTMAKEQKPKLYIYLYNDKYYMKYTADSITLLSLDDTGSYIGKDPITIKGVNIDPITLVRTEHPVTFGNYLTISYKRYNGAFDDTEYYDYLEIADDNKTYKIHLVKLTGKHYIKID